MKKIVIVFMVIIAVIACKKNNKILSFSERTSEIRTSVKKVIKGTDTTNFYDPALLIGAKIPIFEIASLDSTIFNNNSIYGKKAILHFWYRTCPNCMTELPGLIKFYDEFRNQNIEVLSFARDTKDELSEVIKSVPFNFPVLVNCGPLMDFTFEHMYGYPFILYVDEKGVITNYIRGESNETPSADGMYQQLKTMVQGNKK